MNGNDKPADIMTNSHASNTWFPLMKPLLFWHDMIFLKERVVANKSEIRSSTPPIYQAKGTTQQLFKLDLFYILGE